MKFQNNMARIVLVFCVVVAMSDATPFNIFQNTLNKIKQSINQVIGDKSVRADGKPWFCHELDCPEFKTVRKIKVKNDDGDDVTIEERCYPQTNWVKTSMDGKKDDMSYSPMFRKLFKYITGENVEKAKIEMTAPVLVSVKDMNDDETSHASMGFFIPPAEAASAPAPTRDDVTVGQMSPMCVYVLSYGGWQMSLNSKFRGKVDELKANLKKAGIEDIDESAGPMFAGYDSPWRLLNRHNEVMLLKKKPEVKEN